MPCLGNGEDHCCYVKGEPCPFLIRDYTDETGRFRKWACVLRAHFGNWDDVVAHPGYQRVAAWAWADGLNCRDWPEGEGVNKGTCKACGIE